MIRKAFILFALVACLQLILISCMRQQKCKGKFNLASLEFGKHPGYDFSLLSYSQIKFDSIILSNTLGSEVYDCYSAAYNPLVQSAYAFKPAPPIVAMQERLDSVHFITLRDYNANYPKGSNINNLLVHVLRLHNDWGSDGLSTVQVLQRINSSLVEPSTYYLSGFYSKFKEKPAVQNDTVQIGVIYYVSSGIKLEAVSKPMIVIQ